MGLCGGIYLMDDLEGEDPIRQVMMDQILEYELNSLRLSEALTMLTESMSKALSKKSLEELTELYRGIFNTNPEMH
jgi:hypothetical protein